MVGQVVYLDSSAVLKRYVREPGSSRVREVFLKAYSGELVLSYSVWNIGEVLGALDRARASGRLSGEAYELARRRFVLEARRMVKLGLALVIPLKIGVLKESWKLLEKHHIYEADALQIASAKYVNAAHFMTGDKRLHEVAVEEGLRSEYLSPSYVGPGSS
ncbi:type II toxin-antitoxin system VapC family toxin [Infirmifilum lucidum]|uniref:Type II toxin-antitoxin system VapC family toxin n=1 Tax=Infirmifilum lucidum TaxID=2776706 RepID=A0A7L9FIT2_9CREN|nr:type II toxin-antitoxin system VapC family toxin [Infirmifilum lucidum]QOJ79262.1 type II toxin-antitoxin system VapC family toxin [Infirmifilum lucidum]